MTPDEKIRRGSAADRLLKDALLTEAFNELKLGYMRQWESTAVDDKDGRECLWLAHRIVGKVEKHLQNVAASGKLEQKQIDDLARSAKAKRSIFG